MRFVYRDHALKRTVERSISPAEVEAVVQNGTTIEDYPQTKPLPLRLILGFIRNRPLHVLAAHDAKSQTMLNRTSRDGNQALR